MVLSLVEGAVADWYPMLPQVQLWLNLRTSAVHGFTPFSLMFNRPFVGFKDFENTPIDLLTPEQLEKRYNLALSWLYPTCSAKQSATAQKRMEKFNKKRSVQLEPFPDGSYVMMKNLRRHNKLGQRYHGPYRVLRRTQGGSYVLLDQQGCLLPRNVAPSHLKLVSYETVQNALDAGDSTIAPAEAIVLHRGRPGQREYKVRWAGYGDEDDTWEEASNLDQALIRKYWERVQHDETLSSLIGLDQETHNDATPQDIEVEQEQIPAPAPAELHQEVAQPQLQSTATENRRKGKRGRAARARPVSSAQPRGFLEGLQPISKEK
jgi:hypothetical protein